MTTFSLIALRYVRTITCTTLAFHQSLKNGHGLSLLKDSWTSKFKAKPNTIHSSLLPRGAFQVSLISMEDLSNKEKLKSYVGNYKSRRNFMRMNWNRNTRNLMLLKIKWKRGNKIMKIFLHSWQPLSRYKSKRQEKLK